LYRFKNRKIHKITVKNKYSKEKKKQKSIALERIEELLKQAEKANPERAKKYIALARRISSRTKTRIPKELKRRFCRHCNSYLHIGTNARVRLNRGKKTYFCLSCGKFTRIPYK